jgi:hypothetical protein
MRRASVILLGVALVAALGTYAAFQGRGQPVGAAAAKPGADAFSGVISKQEWAALKREVAALRAEVAELKRLRPQAGPAQARGAEPDAVPARTFDPARAGQDARQRRERMDAIESAFRSEPADPEWSATATAAVQDALNHDQAVLAGLRALECRAQTCRVEVVGEGGSSLALALFMPSLAQKLGPILPNMIIDEATDPGGLTITVLYLSKSPG